MIRMDLSNEQRQEVQQVNRQAVGCVALRVQMVLLCARGYRVPQIAQIHDCGEDVMRLWLHRYRTEGIAGLADEPRSVAFTTRLAIRSRSRSPNRRWPRPRDFLGYF